MKILRQLPAHCDSIGRGVTIGNFDGVHIGHQLLIAHLRRHAIERDLRTCVLTFDPPPSEFFAPASAPRRASSLRDKIAALAECEVDEVCILRFDAALAAVSAETFVDDLLGRALGTRLLMVGDDFRFGAGRRGNFDMLAERSAAAGFEVRSLETVQAAGNRVSSTLLREALRQGDYPLAHRLLGRPYCISGHVVRGRQLGRELGFPTLNIRFPGGRGATAARPAAHGVDVVRVHGLGSKPLHGVSSLGMRPAVQSNGKPWLEVHLLEGGGNLYGKLVSVEFLARLRAEQHFDSLDALKSQIAQDCAHARTWFEGPMIRGV